MKAIKRTLLFRTRQHDEVDTFETKSIPTFESQRPYQRPSRRLTGSKKSLNTLSAIDTDQAATSRELTPSSTTTHGTVEEATLSSCGGDDSNGSSVRSPPFPAWRAGKWCYGILVSFAVTHNVDKSIVFSVLIDRMWPQGAPSENDWWVRPSSISDSAAIADHEIFDFGRYYDSFMPDQQTCVSLDDKPLAVTSIVSPENTLLNSNCRFSTVATAVVNNNHRRFHREPDSIVTMTSATLQFRNCGLETWHQGRRAWCTAAASVSSPSTVGQSSISCLFSGNRLRNGGTQARNNIGRHPASSASSSASSPPSRRLLRQIVQSIHDRTEMKLPRPIPLSSMIKCYSKVWFDSDDEESDVNAPVMVNKQPQPSGLNGNT
jgi:hypothetical protein